MIYDDSRWITLRPRPRRRKIPHFFLFPRWISDKVSSDCSAGGWVSSRVSYLICYKRAWITRARALLFCDAARGASKAGGIWSKFSGGLAGSGSLQKQLQIDRAFAGNKTNTATTTLHSLEFCTSSVLWLFPNLYVTGPAKFAPSILEDERVWSCNYTRRMPNFH